jgi:hypothetical protein
MGYCMATHHDTGVSMSPHPPQDGRWATFVPASYKNMALGEAELSANDEHKTFCGSANGSELMQPPTKGGCTERGREEPVSLFTANRRQSITKEPIRAPIEVPQLAIAARWCYLLTRPSSCPCRSTTGELPRRLHWFLRTFLSEAAFAGLGVGCLACRRVWCCGDWEAGCEHQPPPIANSGSRGTYALAKRVCVWEFLKQGSKSLFDSRQAFTFGKRQYALESTHEFC